MSIKDLFSEKQNVKTIQDLNKEDIGKDVESVEYLDTYKEIQKRFIPPTDFKDPKNFVKFGSAESYYTDAIERIYNTYPYDGSLHEKLEWEHSSSFLDLHVFNNEYPRTTGYALFSPSGWGSLVGSQVNSFGLTDNPEYIQIKGGPHSGEIDRAPYTNANIYDTSKKRASNLALNFDEGVAVEFWMKKAAKVSDSLTGLETIFDVWNGDYSSTGYGRFFIGFLTSESTCKITVVTESGSVNNTVNSADFIASLDDKWHHYAVSVRNGSSNLETTFYKDGEFITSLSSADAGSGKVNEITGSLIANIGACRLPALDITAAGALSSAERIDGYGKLSGSIDEFRFWKNERTAKQIGTYWRDQVGGGTNTDDANTDLGVYYKFNEGIVGTGSYDSVVLDYSGRISNGTWTGYSTSSRATGSAIMESSASAKEFRDPIIRSNHPKVASYKDLKIAEGREYDFRNTTSIIHSIPTWIIEQDETVGGNTLKKMIQVISNYFDNLSLQMDHLPKLRDTSYLSSSFTPPAFMDRILDSSGLPLEADLFDLASALEYYKSRDEERVFEKRLHEVKNLIYKNVYNNLTHIYKSKGTEKAFRNMMRCFGVDDEIYKINLYASDEAFEFKDNYASKTDVKKYINFNKVNHTGAVVYQYKDTTNPNATSFLAGTNTLTSTKEGAGHALTVESEVFFPKKVLRQSVYFGDQVDIKSGSLFGMHTANDIENTSTAWATHNYANFQVYAVRTTDVVTGDLTKDAYFLLNCTDSGSGGLIPKLKSPKFKNVFDNKEWNFAVRLKPNKYQSFPAISGSTDGPDSARGYDVEFYGVNSTLDIVDNEFSVSASINKEEGYQILTSPKRLYAGAHRQNFTGSVLTASDIKAGSLRFWNTYLTDAVIKQHAFDAQNYGTENPIKNAFLTEETLTAAEVPEIKTLALNWDFSRVTGSDAAGQFVVDDFSSGSAKVRYGWLGNALDKQHTGRGDNFDGSEPTVQGSEYILSARKQLPEIVLSSDTVKVLSRDDERFTRNTRPSRTRTTIEKSMYATISEEMLNMFSSIAAFNNIVGEPADKYRQKYKKLEKLRQLFFERVNNTPSIEKYLDFYKWMDGALSEMLRKLVPVSADFSDKTVQTIVESHVLERNKYHHKFPTLEFKGSDPEANVAGVNELMYDWKHGHAPVDSADNAVGSLFFVNPGTATDGSESVTIVSTDGTSKTYTAKAANDYASNEFDASGAPTDNVTQLMGAINHAAGHNNGVSNSKIILESTSVSPGRLLTMTQVRPGFDGETTITSTLANTTVRNFTGVSSQGDNHLWWKDRADRKGVLSSGNTAVDDNKEKIHNAYTTVNVSGSTYAIRKFSKPYRFSTSLSRDLRGGTNFSKNKKIDYWRVGNASADVLVSTIAEAFGDFDKWNVTASHSDNSALTTKTKQTWKFSNEAIQDKIASFFNVYKTSVSKNPGTFWENESLEIVNLHNDVYGPDKERPMQGPFTEKHVGGLQHRHAKINTGFDNEQTRPEAWRIEKTATGFEIHSPDQKNDGTLDKTVAYAPYYRDVMAKRPVNIRNIQMTTGSVASGDDTGVSPTVIGNYAHDYEIVQTSGRSINNRYFVKNEGIAEITSVRSYEMSGAYDFALPDRSLSDKNKTVFVERFSAPGGPEINGRGFLDTVAEEYAVNNALPWRNSIVRNHLNDLHQKPSGRFGTHFDNGDAGKATFSSASYHKTYRNRQRRLEITGNVEGDHVHLSWNAYTASNYDNWFIQRPIPQSDMQYSWVTASATKGPVGYQQPNYSNASLASTDIVVLTGSEFGSYRYDDNNRRYWGTYEGQVHTNDDVSNFTFVDFVGLNHNIVDPITGSQNFLGNETLKTVNLAGVSSMVEANYVNQTYIKGEPTNDEQTEDAPPLYAGVPSILNGLILHRQGPYGWPSWKQIRTGNHPVVRRHKKDNTLSFNFREDEITNYTEPMITTKYHPMIHNLEIQDASKLLETRQAVVKHTYANNLTQFVKRDNQISIEQRLGIQPNPDKQMYDQINYLLYTDEIDKEYNAVKELNYVTHRETVFPKEEHTFLDKIRGRDSYTCPFWRENKTDREQTNFVNSQGVTVPKQSIWALDERKDWATSSPTSSLSQSSYAGELQNNYTIYHGVSNIGSEQNPHAFLCPSPILNYPRWDYPDWGGSAHNTDNVIFVSSQKWETAEQAGKEPFTVDYRTFANEMRRVAKDYSVLPEFRISEHMPYYINEKGGNFRSKNLGYLTISGSSTPDSSDAEFYTTYSHSDFMKYFGQVQEDYVDKGVHTSKLTLRMDAMMKLLPYDGFYPATRTVQLASLFSSSYGENVSVISGERSFRPFMQPFFAPGILYNTIKSGVAVDWPLMKNEVGSAPFGSGQVGSPIDHMPTRYALTSSAGAWYDDLTGVLWGGSETYVRRPRVPFEALVEPENVPALLQAIPDANPHPSASLSTEVQWDASGSPLYKLAMHNFLAETVDFFLEDGNLQSFVSAPDNSPNHFIVDEEVDVYLMDVLMYRETTYQDTQYEYYNNVKPVNKNYSKLEMCDNWACFGPPVDHMSPVIAGIFPVKITGSSRDPYTPPYYHGLSRARLKFKPNKGPGKYTLPEIMENIDISFRRVLGSSNGGSAGTAIEQASDSSIASSPGTFATMDHWANCIDGNKGSGYYSVASAEQMRLDACLNLRSLTNVKSVEYGPPQLIPDGAGAHKTLPGTPKLVRDDPNAPSKWVIQTKFETPVLNFKDKSTVTPTHGTGSVVNGIWLQYGDIPEDTGIYFQIRDPVQYLVFGDKKEDGTTTISAANDAAEPDEWRPPNDLASTGSTGSLGHLCGFKFENKKIGQIAPTKRISEAVVAIPFRQLGTNQKKFFNIPRNTVEKAVSLAGNPNQKFDDKYIDPDKAMVDMVSKMQRFVIPPRLDFLTHKDIQPFAMYIFEFTHDLSQKDLSDIWQNLPPDDTVGGTQVGIGRDFKQQSQIITHDLLATKEKLQDRDVHPLVPKFPKNTKWMLFKVKQKANTNYFTKTADSRDDARFKFNFEVGSKGAEKESVPDYSYNWPYDYFSLVELVKMDASVKFEDTNFVMDDVTIDVESIAKKAAKIKKAGKKFNVEIDPPISDLINAASSKQKKEDMKKEADKAGKKGLGAPGNDPFKGK